MTVTILMQQVSSAIFKMIHMMTHSYCLEIQVSRLMTHIKVLCSVLRTIHLMTHCFSSIKVKDQLYDPHAVFQ